MFRHFLLVLGALGLLLVSPWRASAQGAPAQNAAAKHVWTNEDLDHLRAEGSISYFNPAPELLRAKTATTASEPASEATATVSIPRPPALEDPEWYAEQAAALNALLALDQASLQLAETNVVLAQEGRTQPGVDLAEGNPGVTPESGLDVLQARVRDDEILLDQLSDLARRHDIEPGVLRG